ncbi:MAG: type II secretion system protein [Sedimentisphaerales bacterium]|nr:type II secretion system protein [Sedimentisphaerales bacterium]
MMRGTGEGGQNIAEEQRQWNMEGLRRRGFSVIELLVVLFIISLLLSIMVPALGRARRHARRLQSKNNLREIARAVNVYAMDNEDRYPISVATNGPDVQNLSWTAPNRLVAVDAQGPRQHRSVASYLSAYVNKVQIMHCPSAPRPFKYLEQAWDMEDRWDNPDNGVGLDELRGTYCFYWGYRGYLPDSGRIFAGPQTAAGRTGQSDLLATDYFAYDHHRHPEAFASCERFRTGGHMTGESSFYPSYWQIQTEHHALSVQTSAVFTDGHVDSYGDDEQTVALKISLSCDGGKPFPDPLKAGTFFIPRQAVR